ncbi:SH3 domain containing ring finger posh isoform X2 [Bombus vancouverensis nearcticus]|uniref:RING-type E3 ubiquitin transferase n=2 Tax=Pyrobombus TaxID=144703 RepID=A0A6P8NE28_9HYME|nr:E3 ubiquitin-protein ligase SH3RF3 isoform X2 [Bombus impatiens]XP_033187780.1 E3 ubiquitin-protein ligase SH3RF3-like isoform X2 [Bombus vancouverensis nearcticus]XP_033312710.1 E3 ubiquitin-protein ligase SH3RF3-like isoform X2 [Bombus bifarius]
MDECMLNDLLECSVCLERLDTSSKVLPCQHTFCKKCLEEIVSTHRELRCPECRILVDAKVDDLPPNVLLMRILEGMRNAAPKSTKSITKSNAGPQRLFGGHQVTSTPIVTTSPTPVAFTNEPVRHGNATAKQVQLHNQTYGRAIYDYVSKVPGDLSFKKGDIVILRKKIDNNWCFGESASSHGVFPLSYVQVITPLTPDVPQCKALYDFRMTNDDEDGCLTFNKGEIISVIRRVDENWAEGKLLDRIGIFPLAFVELNSVARALMKLSTNAQPGPSRVAPPTPTNEETTLLIPTDHSRNLQTSQPRPQLVQNTVLPVSDSISNVSSGGSSSTTTPNTPNSSTTSSSSSTAPSSPSSPATSPPAVGNRHNVKRHSFTAVNTGHQAHPHHRHSAEILSPAVDNAIGSSTNNCSNDSFSSLQTSTSIADHNLRHRRSGSSDLALAQSSQSSSATTGNTHLPAAYIALYPYKPQKADELELRKGGVYMVTERCQDGWFKGTSNRTQKCGVFPGNYVTLAKCQRGLCRGSPNTGQHQNFPSSTSQNNTESRITTTYTKNKGATPQPYNARTLLPPELPPRAISPSFMVSSSWHGQSQTQSQENSPPRYKEQNSANPLGRSHSAVMSSNISSPGKQVTLPQSLMTTTTVTGVSNSGTVVTGATSSIMNEVNKSPNSVLHAVASPSSTASVSVPKNTEKQKEKKDKCVSLMRRLTNIKKSKSPPPTTYSMDNPVFEDGNSINPVHVRSNESGGMACTPMGNHHRKSNSLDAGMGKQTKQQPTRERERVYRFRCIVPYPPNSEFELELRVGDIIYVHKKRDDGWYKGTQQRTGRTGLFPASFVEAF